MTFAEIQAAISDATQKQYRQLRDHVDILLQRQEPLRQLRDQLDALLKVQEPLLQLRNQLDVLLAGSEPSHDLATTPAQQPEPQAVPALEIPMPQELAQLKIVPSAEIISAVEALLQPVPEPQLAPAADIIPTPESETHVEPTPSPAAVAAPEIVPQPETQPEPAPVLAEVPAVSIPELSPEEHNARKDAEQRRLEAVRQRRLTGRPARVEPVKLPATQRRRAQNGFPLSRLPFMKKRPGTYRGAAKRAPIGKPQGMKKIWKGLTGFFAA